MGEQAGQFRLRPVLDLGTPTRLFHPPGLAFRLKVKEFVMDFVEYPISNGRFTCKVDVDDVKMLDEYKWFAVKMNGKKIYAARRSAERKQILMHRQIMQVTDKGKCVDHINGDSMDNRKSNLRLCTQGENMRNYRNAWGKEGIRGIRQTRTGKFRARIKLNRKHYEIGTFDTQHDASVAYAFASSLLHGEFGSLPGHEKFLTDNEADET